MEVLLSVIVPLVGAGIIVLYPSRSRLIALLCTGISFCALLTRMPEIDHSTEYIVSIWMNPLTLCMVVDGFSLLFALLCTFLFLMVLLYSSYIAGRQYYSLLLLNLGVFLLMVFSSQVFFFYLFLEMSALITYFLVVHNKTDEAVRAGFKYIIMNVGGAVLILLAILLRDGSAAAFLFAAGCLIKAGSFPVHVWLAEAHPAAPSPVSALLSGILVKIGVYGLFKFAPQFGVELSLIVPFALSSMIFGAFLAFIQKDIKRILAYHTISQVGFILLGIGLETSSGVSGGLFHFINHALFKTLLFLCMGCVIYSTGERTLNHLGGLLSKMPVTAVTCLIACFSISGIPPFNGFVSKVILFHALESPVQQALFYVACIGTVASFTKLFRHVFLGTSEIVPKPVPLSLKVPLVALSGLCVLLGVYPGIVLGVLEYADYHVWTFSILSECFLIIVCGVAVYYVGLKTKIILNPPVITITIDRFFHESGKAVEYCSRLLLRILTRDINYYVAYIVVVILGFLLWFHVGF
jgi:hydrogenase-4 component B